MHIESIPSFAILLGVLIFVHEFGHFIVAKKLGIKVVRFSLGFGPILLRKQWGETEYVLSAIPLGGYVKLHGEETIVEDAGVTDAVEEVEDEDEEDGDPATRFNLRPVSHRMAVVFAGPIMNLVLGFVLFCFLSLFGEQVLLPVVGQVEQGMPAYEAGLLEGDRIITVDGKVTDTWTKMQYAIMTSGEDAMVLEVDRDDEVVVVNLNPIHRDDDSYVIIGIRPKGDTVMQEGASLLEAPVEGFKSTVEVTVQTFDVIVRLVTGRGNSNEIGGPIAIFNIAGQAMNAGFRYFIYLMAALSINLMVLNLLPVPVLDGGHLAFYLFEAVVGRPVHTRFREVAQQVGLVILVSLIMFVIYNDIMRIQTG